MSSNNTLVPTTEKMVKEGINNMETKPNLVKIDIIHHKEKIKLKQSTK